MVETKKGKLVNFRLRKHEDPVIIDWIEKQSNLSGAFRYFITKEVANYGIQDLSEKAPERVSEEQALNDFYNDILHALPKLKQEQKMMMLFKLQSELPTAFQSGLQMQPVAVSTPIPVDVPVSTPTPIESQV